MLYVHCTLCGLYFGAVMEYSGSDSGISSVLDYAVDYANDIIEEISDHFKDILDTVKCKRALDLQGEMFKNPNKNKWSAEWIVELCDTLRRSRMLFLGATIIGEENTDSLDSVKSDLSDSASDF